MTKENLLTRREFTLESALAMLAGVTITISGCGSDGGGGGGSTTGPSPQTGSKTGTVSANHGHIAEILAAQLTAGLGISLDIRGQATHPHTVTLTQAEMTQINAGTRVTKESSNDNAHTHSVTFN